MNLRMIVPIEIAVVALLGAIVFGFDAVRGSGADSTVDASRAPTPESAEATPEVATTRLINEKGGFAVGVPEDIEAAKVGPGVGMTSADRALNVVITPVEAGTLATSRSGFLRGMRKDYTNVRVTTTETREVDGRKARATFGQARNAQKVPVRFLNVVVKGTPRRNFAITSFTAGDSDPMFVVPRVNAVFDTFEVMK